MQNDDATESETSGAGVDGDKETTAKTSDSSDEKQTEASGKTFTQDDLDAIVQKRLAKERKKWESDKDLTELDRLKKENEELKKEAVKSRVIETFDRAASKQGVKNTRGLFRAIESDLEYDENGKVSNLENVLKAAKADLPEFFAGASLGDADGKKGGDRKTTGGGGMNDLIRSGFGRS